MLTATDRAQHMARQVLIFARLHNDCVVTSDLVDAVMSRDAGTEQGKASPQTVRRMIRQWAEADGVRVIFSRQERFWAIREQLHHMSDGAVEKLRADIISGGERDPRWWDGELNEALAIRLGPRPVSDRIRGCSPVSVKLWPQPPHNRPTPDDVVDAPHAHYMNDRQVHAGLPAERIRTFMGNWRANRLAFAQGADGSLLVGSSSYVPRQFHVRVVNGSTPELIDSPSARLEVKSAERSPRYRVVRDGSSARVACTETAEVVELRPAAPEDVDRYGGPKSERHALGDLVVVRPVEFDRESGQYVVRPEYVGQVVSWTDPRFNVRALVADERGYGVQECPVRELRPATREEITRAVVENFADPLDEATAAFFAETYQAVADGTAVPVRADRVAAGMVVVAAVRLEDRTVGTVTAHRGPGAPWVRVTWEPRTHQDSVTGDGRTYEPGHHLVVTVESLAALATGTAPVRQGAGEPPAAVVPRPAAEVLAGDPIPAGVAVLEGMPGRELLPEDLHSVFGARPESDGYVAQIRKAEAWQLPNHDDGAHIKAVGVAAVLRKVLDQSLGSARAALDEDGTVYLSDGRQAARYIPVGQFADYSADTCPGCGTRYAVNGDGPCSGGRSVPPGAGAPAPGDRAEEVRRQNERLEAQRLATNQVIEERARALLVEAGHTEAEDGRAGFVFLTNWLAVKLRGVTDQAEEHQDQTDALARSLEAHGWYAEPSKFNGLSVFPPYGEAADVVREGARRRERAEENDRVRARKFAAKWRADGHTEEPTDTALKAAFASCVRPPRVELYRLIRDEIAGWDARP